MPPAMPDAVAPICRSFCIPKNPNAMLFRSMKAMVYIRKAAGMMRTHRCAGIAWGGMIFLRYSAAALL
jgi:hypothetical protein